VQVRSVIDNSMSEMAQDEHLICSKLVELIARQFLFSAVGQRGMCPSYKITVTSLRLRLTPGIGWKRALRRRVPQLLAARCLRVRNGTSLPGERERERLSPVPPNMR